MAQEPRLDLEDRAAQPELGVIGCRLVALLASDHSRFEEIPDPFDLPRSRPPLIPVAS